MDDNLKITLWGIFFVVVIGIGLLQPYFEMKTFNKFSNVEASYWDAVFSNLRVTPGLVRPE